MIGGLQESRSEIGGWWMTAASSVSLVAEVSMNTHCLPLKAFGGKRCAEAACDSGVHCTWRGTHRWRDKRSSGDAQELLRERSVHPDGG